VNQVAKSKKPIGLSVSAAPAISMEFWPGISLEQPAKVIGADQRYACDFEDSDPRHGEGANRVDCIEPFGNRITQNHRPEGAFLGEFPYCS
jgi:hypothetical protein